MVRLAVLRKEAITQEKFQPETKRKWKAHPVERRKEKKDGDRASKHVLTSLQRKFQSGCCQLRGNRKQSDLVPYSQVGTLEGDILGGPKQTAGTYTETGSD